MSPISFPDWFGYVFVAYVALTLTACIWPVAWAAAKAAAGRPRSARLLARVGGGVAGLVLAGVGFAIGGSWLSSGWPSTGPILAYGLLLFLVICTPAWLTAIILYRIGRRPR